MMTKYTETIPDDIIARSGYPLDSHDGTHPGPLFLDIETLGLSAGRYPVYLIGCAYLEPDTGGFVLEQRLADTPEDEALIIADFMQEAARHSHVITFGGDRFELPFLTGRASLYGIVSTLETVTSLDIYRHVAPWRDFLGLPDCKRRTVELFLGVDRREQASGKELIALYKQYQRSRDKALRDRILTHNADDIRGLFLLIRMLSYEELFDSVLPYAGVDDSPEALPVRTDVDPFPEPATPYPLTATRVQADTYECADGSTRIELVIHGHIRGALPSSAGAGADGCMVRLEGTDFTIRVPAYDTELKYFYSNYRDYYYLPEEDEALHKSISSYVDKAHRVQADATNCYTRKSGRFLPEWGLVLTPFFKRDYADTSLFFELTDTVKVSRSAMSLYATHILAHILEKT